MTEQENSNVDVDKGLQVPPFQGEKALSEALEQSIIYACEQGEKSLCFCDGDFAVWPLSSERVLEALTQWARHASNQRRLTVMAANYLIINQKHAAWQRWRKTWGHRVDCLEVEGELDAEVPCVFLSDHVMLTVHNKDTCAGHMTQERSEVVAMRLHLEELKRTALPASPVTTLGL